MSKERARRREKREREAAVKQAARDAAERRAAKRRALAEPVLGPWRRVRTSLTTGRQTGPLAERRRMRIRLIVAALFFAQLVVWVVRPDWEARFGAFVISLFVFPLALAFAL